MSEASASRSAAEPNGEGCGGMAAGKRRRARGATGRSFARNLSPRIIQTWRRDAEARGEDGGEPRPYRASVDANRACVCDVRCARACAPRENDATDEPTVTSLSSEGRRAREFARLARTAARGRTDGTSPCMSVCCSKEILHPP